jgi:hypothetical protein
MKVERPVVEWSGVYASVHQREAPGLPVRAEAHAVDARPMSVRATCVMIRAMPSESVTPARPESSRPTSERINRRSQVQILPPLLEKPPVAGLFCSWPGDPASDLCPTFAFACREGRARPSWGPGGKSRLRRLLLDVMPTYGSLVLAHSSAADSARGVSSRQGIATGGRGGHVLAAPVPAGPLPWRWARANGQRADGRLRWVSGVLAGTTSRALGQGTAVLPLGGRPACPTPIAGPLQCGSSESDPRAIRRGETPAIGRLTRAEARWRI